MTFIDIGIDINIVEALARIGIKTPTPVQATSIGKIPVLARPLPSWSPL